MRIIDYSNTMLSGKLIILTALAGVLLSSSNKSAFAQDPAKIATTAKAITVRIEGATLGSGVIIKRDGDLYTILTAWHVIKNQGKNEELDIILENGKRYSSKGENTSRLGEIDLATVTFQSKEIYQVAKIGNSHELTVGSKVFVYGFPLPTSTVPHRIPRFLTGELIANSNRLVKDGYQLIYSNPTLPGMSGGALLDTQGLLVGIHGRGETDIQLTEMQGIAVKTGNNLAIPISFYSSPQLQPEDKQLHISQNSYSDYIAMADNSILAGDYNSGIEYVKKALAIKETISSYSLLSSLLMTSGKKSKANIAAYKALRINPLTAHDFYERGILRRNINKGSNEAVNDFRLAYEMSPNNFRYFVYYIQSETPLKSLPILIERIKFASGKNNQDSYYIPKYCSLLRYEIRDLNELYAKEKISKEQLLKPTFAPVLGEFLESNPCD